MTAPLTDFEPSQLNYLLSVIEEKIETVQLVRLKAEYLEDEQAMDDIISGCDRDLDTLQSFQVQLCNARNDIKWMGSYKIED